MVLTPAAMRRAVWMVAAAAGVVAGAAAAPQLAPGRPVLGLLPAGTVLLPGLRLAHTSPVPSVAAGPAPVTPEPTERVLWNFTVPGATVDGWTESSDGTARQAGMSTGALKLQKTARFQRAVMFSLLNPQPNGAGFVGFVTTGNWDLSQFSAIRLRARAQGENFHYKVYLKHHGEGASVGGSYESYFEMPPGQLTTVTIPLDSFAFYYRGQLEPDAPPLDTTDITSFGLQIYGGVYSEFKQSGVSSLEIDWITAA
ncbi:uncharacterized protein LOC122364268 [Amphibalanus amphitrite]|uniref:uncharacterized protein LOC122364268 n=1 Tax=Amphibalanus amphitrite TaxID=1232801 RepID=UPI001C92B5DF|nr:uncharacterized protein LOC122364268 [Amphibalanus amphitrite]